MKHQLDEPATVRITIYDVAGRKVARLLDGVCRPAGPSAATLIPPGSPRESTFFEMRSPSQKTALKVTIVD